MDIEQLSIHDVKLCVTYAEDVASHSSRAGGGSCKSDLHTVFLVYKVVATAVHVGASHGSKIEKGTVLAAR